MNLETSSVLIFLGIIAILVYLDRKNIEFNYGLMIRRTKRGKKAIYEFGKKHRKKLLILGNVGVVICIVASVFGLFMLVRSSYNILSKPEEAEPEIKLVLPSVKEIDLPEFVLGVPFWYWIIGIFTVLFAHEPMHALLARAEKIRIKSFGLLLLFVLPGAFVDPDEKQIKKLSILKKLRIYAAGSFGNLIFAGIFLLLIVSYNFMIDSLMVTEGVIFEKTIENTGAEEVELVGTIIGINNKEVRSMTDFVDVLEDVKPGDVIEVKTTQGNFQIKTTPHPDDPERPFIGVSNARSLFVYKGLLEGWGLVSERTLYVLSWILGLFGWIFALNVGIGVFNLFPIKPLDGGLMFEEIVKHFYKDKKVRYLVIGVSLITLGLVLINLFGPSIIAWIG